MKHLDVLEYARLISVRRKGRERWNYINAAPLRSIYERWLTPFQQLWAASLSNLGSIVEGEPMPEASAKNAVSNDEIVQKVSFAAPPERVFDALTKNIARWWSHLTYDHESKPDLRLETHAGGRFVEIQDAKERLYGIVTRIEPPSILSLQGAMGMGGCIFATIAFEITSAETGSDLTLTHSVVGVYDQSMIEMYRGGWRSLLEDALKAFVEGRTEATHVA